MREMKEIKVEVERALRKAIKTGKVYLGSKRTLKALRNNEAKMVVIANNCPKKILEEIEKQVEKQNIRMLKVDKNNMELGAMCGKPFSVAALAIIDEGNSEILSM